jgi:hypothetical protein
MQLVYYRGTNYFYRNDLAVSKELASIASETYVESPGEVIRHWWINFKYMTTSQTHFDVLFQLLESRHWYHALPQRTGLDAATLSRKLYHLSLEAARAAKWAYTLLPLLGVLLLVLSGFKNFASFTAMHILYFTGLTSFVAGYDRYRLNLEPFYCALFASSVTLSFTHLAHLLKRNLIKKAAEPGDGSAA